MAVGVAISAGFLALKICMIRRHLSDNDSADLKNTPQGKGAMTKRTCTALQEKGLSCLLPFCVPVTKYWRQST